MAELPGSPDWVQLTQGALELGVSLDGGQIAALERYLDLLIEWNQRFNLTAIAEPEEVLTKHFLDSLACARVVDFATQHTLVDVGTGAGFPGMVLKIAFPHLRLTLLDAIRKRLGFLEHVAAELKLDGVEILHARAEDVTRPDSQAHSRKGPPREMPPSHRERFDVVAARAVARLNVLAEWTLPFAKIGGQVILMKGPDVKEEVEEAAHALSLLGGGPPEVLTLQLPGTDIGRSLVRVPKLRATPRSYPRPSGIARKSPL